MSRKKSDIKRPYPPAYLSRASLAYRLDMSESKIDELVSAGILPQPLLIDRQRRWSWREVDSAIQGAQNNVADDSSIDEMSEGIQSVAKKDANGAADRRHAR